MHDSCKNKCICTYVPRKWAVLDGFLAVLAPPVAVIEVVDLALGQEREPRLPRPLLALALARPADHHPCKHTCQLDQIPCTE
jgi:hypothetical protein